jgi:hypothetical protein
MTSSLPSAARCVVPPPTPKPVRALALGICAAAACLLSAAPALAAMYKWTDANGRVVYSDQPPPGNVKAEIITGASPPANPNAVKDFAAKEAEVKKRQLERTEAAEKAAQASAETDRRQAECAQARGRLRALNESQANLYKLNEKGERVYLDDAMRRSEIAEQERLLRQYCGG